MPQKQYKEKKIPQNSFWAGHILFSIDPLLKCGMISETDSYLQKGNLVFSICLYSCSSDNEYNYILF